MDQPGAGTVAATAADGARLTLEVTGRGETLLFVHGAASDARQWSRVAPLLAGRFTVVAMNRRARRGSDPFPDGYDVEVEYADVRAVAESLSGRVHLVGHSSGARYALHAAGRIPGLASLVLYEPPLPEEPTTRALGLLEQLAADGDRESVLHCFFVDVLRAEEEDFAALRRRAVWPYMVDNALTVPIELRGALAYRFEASAFASLDLPVLLLVGAESDAHARHVNDALAGTIPAARLVSLDRQGHGAMIAAPELFADTIEAFISSLA